MTTTFTTFTPNDIQFETPVIRMALRRNNIAIWEYCFKTHTLKFNKVLFRVLGFSPNMFLPSLESYKSIIHPDDIKRVEKSVSECLTSFSKRTSDIQFRIKTQRGTWKWVSNKSSIERDADGIPMKCIGTVMDITKLKETENAALEKNRHLNELVDSLTDYIVEIDSEYRIVDTWVHRENMYRNYLKALHGIKVGDIFGRRLTETCVNLIDQTLATGVTKQIEYKAKKVNRCFMVRTSKVSNRLNGSKTVSVIIQDITKRKKDKFDLKQKESNLTAMIQNTSDVFWTLDRENKIILYNKAFEELHLRINNRSPEVGDRLCVGMLLKKSLEKCEVLHQRSLKGASTTIMRPVHFFNKTKLYYEFKINPLKDENGDVIGSVVSGRDINQIYEAKLEAEAATELKSKFVSTVSHELRTPLNAILGMANHLAKFNTQESLIEDIAVLKQASDNLIALVSDVLDFSKLDSEKAVINKSEFNFKEYLTDVVKLHSPLVVEKNLTLNVSISDNLPQFILFDKSKLNQIISNLFSNAVKFTETGTITFKVSQVDENPNVSKIHFLIEDTGIGIPKEEISNVFKSFNQSSISTQKLIGGTGLGLAITKKLVDLLGGDISVKSEPKVGSSFFVEFDFEVIEKLKEMVSTQDLIGKNLTGLHVLVAEDNEINAKIITRLLGQWGATFDLAENGKVAVEFAMKNTYDVVLMDIQMPIKNGFEATNEIRLLSNNKLTRVLALTAQLDFSFDQGYRQGMFDGHVLKPFQPDDLKESILDIIRNDSMISSLASLS